MLADDSISLNRFAKEAQPSSDAFFGMAKDKRDAKSVDEQRRLGEAENKPGEPGMGMGGGGGFGWSW